MDSANVLIDGKGGSRRPRRIQPTCHHRQDFLIANARFESSATTTKQSAALMSNRKWLPVFVVRDCDPSSYSNLSRRDNARTEVPTEVYNRLRISSLFLRRNRLRWDRTARTATTASAPTTSTAPTRATAPARSSAPPVAAPATSTMAAAGPACVATSALAATSASRGSRGHSVRRGIHSVRVRLAKRVNHRDDDKNDHCHEQRVLGRVLARFLAPEVFQEFQHNSAFDSRGPAIRVLRTAFNLYSPISRELQPGPSCIRVEPDPALAVLPGFVLCGVMRWFGMVYLALMRVFLLVVEPFGRPAREGGLSNHDRAKGYPQKHRREDLRQFHLRPPSRSLDKKLQWPEVIGALKLPLRSDSTYVLVPQSPNSGLDASRGREMVSQLHSKLEAGRRHVSQNYRASGQHNYTARAKGIDGSR